MSSLEQPKSCQDLALTLLNVKNYNSKINFTSKSTELGTVSSDKGIRIAYEPAPKKDTNGKELVYDRQYFRDFDRIKQFTEWRKTDSRGLYVHERIGHTGRPFFDFDTKNVNINREQFEKVVELVCTKVIGLYTKPEDKDKKLQFVWLLPNKNRNDKFGAHLIIKNVFLCDFLDSMKVIGQEVKIALERRNYNDILDTQVYRKNGSLRMAYSIKRKNPGHYYVPKNCDNIEDTYFTCNPDVSYIYPHVTTKLSSCVKTEAVKCSHSDEELEKKYMDLYEQLPDKDEWTPKMETNGLRLVYKNGRYKPCCVCHKESGDESHTISWFNGAFYRNCWHQVTGKKPTLLEKDTVSQEDTARRKEAFKKNKVDSVFMLPKERFNRVVKTDYLPEKEIDELFDLEKPCNIIGARMGVGKTEEVKKILKQHPNSSCFYVTTRKTFAENVCERLVDIGFQSYLNFDFKKFRENLIAGHPPMPRLLCSMESILKTHGMHFDFVILDECEGLWNQFNSETLSEKEQAVFDRFYDIVSNAQHVLCMDAFITQSTFDVMESIFDKDQIHSVYIESKPIHKRVLNVDDADEFIKYMITELDHNNRFVVPASSKKFIQKCEQQLRLQFPHKKIISITADTNDLVKQHMSLRASETWNEYDVVLYSPTIMNGTNVHIPGHFDTMFIYGSPNSVTVRNLLQMAGRCRLFNENYVYCHVAKRKGSQYLSLNYKEILQCEKTFHDQLKALHANYNTIPMLAKVAIARTIYEHNVSKVYYKDLFYRYLTDALGWEVGDQGAANQQYQLVTIPKEKDIMKDISFENIVVDVETVRNQRATTEQKKNVAVWNVVQKLPIGDVQQTPEDFDFTNPKFINTFRYFVQNPKIQENLYVWNRLRHQHTIPQLQARDKITFHKAKAFNDLLIELQYDFETSSTKSITVSGDLLTTLRGLFKLNHKSNTTASVTKTITEVFHQFANLDMDPPPNKKGREFYSFAASDNLQFLKDYSK